MKNNDVLYGSARNTPLTASHNYRKTPAISAEDRLKIKSKHMYDNESNFTG